MRGRLSSRLSASVSFTGSKFMPAREEEPLQTVDLKQLAALTSCLLCDVEPPARLTERRACPTLCHNENNILFKEVARKPVITLELTRNPKDANSTANTGGLPLPDFLYRMGPPSGHFAR